MAKTDDERIMTCKAAIIDAINKAQIPLSVALLILENVQCQVEKQLILQKEADQCQTSTTTAP